jgi:hypothetical protein
MNGSYLMNATRCQFLKSLAPVAGVFAASNLLRAADLNSRLQHACIGVGGMMGHNDFLNFKQHPRTDVVAICDVDEGNLQHPDESGKMMRLRVVAIDESDERPDT